MLLGDDVVADRKAEAGALAGWLGREEWLKELVSQFRRDADAVVADADFNGVAEILRRYLQSGLELGVAPLPLALGGGIEAIAEQIEADAGDVLGGKFDRSNFVGKISLQRDVEARILGAATVIGEVQGLLDQAVEIDAAAFAAAATRMFQHALDDAIGAASVLSDLFQIAGQHPDRFIDLGARVVVERGDRWSGGVLQFIE